MNAELLQLNDETIAHTVERLFWAVFDEGRQQLYEHEVYTLLELVGAISPPQHLFLRVDEPITAEVLTRFTSEKIVLKIVSPEIVHKSDSGGVVFCPNNLAAVQLASEKMLKQYPASARVAGVLLVEYVDVGRCGFGGELFVGVRSTREFGPVIAAGLGGIDAEYLAATMKPGLAVAKALATEVTPEQFMAQFRKTAAYDILSGSARGHERMVADDELLRCFSAFITLARHFCVDRGARGPDLAELEVNPFAFRDHQMIPLDGCGRLQPAVPRPLPRPLAKVQNLLEPKSIAILGVSATNRNFGRIILENVFDCGFDPDHLYVIKEGVSSVDGAPCVPSISDLPETVDLLVIAAAALQLPELIRECFISRKVESVIMIPGGVGETEGSEGIERAVRQSIISGRECCGPGPVFLGPNCLGVQSRPGCYDTFFIPGEKLDKRRGAPGRGVALVSQSGAFIVSRMSNVEMLDPTLAISVGNQIDLTISDLLAAIAQRDDIHTIGIYVEGFNDLDGQDLLRVIRTVTDAGKLVVFYKAGRTESGRDAAAGHTAAIAGDYDICTAGATQAGAVVTDTFREFHQLIEIAGAMHEKRVGGVRIGAVSNAGFESVGVADSVVGQRYQVEMVKLSDATRERLAAALASARLGSIVNARNPLDLTPMAGEAAYESSARVLLEAPEVDALILACVPLSPALSTTAEEIAANESLADILPRLKAEYDKPIVVVIDAGGRYEPLVSRLREAGLPVLRSADQAVRSMGRFIQARSQAQLRKED